MVSKTKVVQSKSMAESLPKVLTEKKKKLWPINIKALDSGLSS